MPYVSNGTSWQIEANTPWATAAAAWNALTTGAIPTVTLGGDAGTGATYTIAGNHLKIRVAITTGALPDVGLRTGVLASLYLPGFAEEPFVVPSAYDDVSASTFPYLVPTSANSAQLKVAGELEPGTTYTYGLLFMGG